MANIYNWSTTAADNANADSSIDWTEGMAPSEVNDSGRFMMARIAELLADIGGAITATGTANAILVTTESAFTTYANGRILSFRAIADNTGAATLSVNSIGTRGLRKITSAGETALTGGEIQAGGMYTVQYQAAMASGSGAWVLLNPTPEAQVTEVPAGAVSAFAMSSAPTGWLKCDGAAVSRTTYANLFAAIGTTWGTGNGSTTFNVPDLRGEFIRGWADGGSVDSGRAFASAQGQAIQGHTHTGTTVENGSHAHTIPRSTSNGTGEGIWGNGVFTGTRATTVAGAHTHSFTTDSTGGPETRPRNKALLYCVKV